MTSNLSRPMRGGLPKQIPNIFPAASPGGGATPPQHNQYHTQSISQTYITPGLSVCLGDKNEPSNIMFEKY